jgi:hypothetical protein
MSLHPDLTARKFGRLTAILRKGSSRAGHAMWLCRCECGREKTATSGNLRAGCTRSCGCLRIRHGHARKGSRSAEHRIWGEMIQRCTNPQSKAWNDYGGRGITVCDRWRDFARFYADMGARPSDEHSIERIDNSNGYEPANCRWATRKEQANNTRRSRLYTLNGETLCVQDWARRAGLHSFTLGRRLKEGMSLEVAMSIPRWRPGMPWRTKGRGTAA